MQKEKCWRDVGRVTVRWQDDRQPKVYARLIDAVEAVGKRDIMKMTRGSLGRYIPLIVGGHFTSGDQVAFYDEHDLYIPIWRVREELARIPNLPYGRWWRRTQPHVFRDGPVSRTGVKHWRGRYYRHPRTTQERRDLAFTEVDEDILDYEVKIRPARRRIPNSWDDIIYSHRGRGWKEYRKTQYLVKRQKKG